MNKTDALRMLGSFEDDLGRLYGQSASDYRGRVVEVDSVQAYLRAERHRFVEVASLLPASPRPGARLLDVGIAYGFLAALVDSKEGWKAEGLEIAENIPVYCAFAKDRGIPVHAGKLGVTPLPFADGTFDAVVFSEVLEHLRLSPKLVFGELRRILAPGGFLIVTTPNMARLTPLLKLLAGRNPHEAFPEDVVSENITEHLTHIREYTMGEVMGLLERHGFSVIEARYSGCMERERAHYLITALVPPWRGNLMVLACKAP